MIEDILGFWFSPDSEKQWFKPTKAFDAELARRYGDLLVPAGAGTFDDWLREPRSALALCLLLDQLPRNIHRGSPKAFLFDAKAREVARKILDAGHDKSMDKNQRLFSYLPFEHSEDASDQARSLALFEALEDAHLIDYARRHKAIIDRFGRFPHRNAVLGRESTPEELAFLEQPGSSF